jgi:multicomponent Na+:H+ antiporter subunit E
LGGDKFLQKNNPVINFIITSVLMMALWFIMSEKTEPKFLLLGALSSLLIAGICLRPLTMKGSVSDNQYFLLKVNPIRFIVYFIWLMWQIAKSAFYVARISLFGRSLVRSSIAWFRADYDNPAARAMLANSITLTPGTITIDITEDGLYSVHALTDEIREGLLDGSMQAKVAWLYGESINFEPVDEKDITAAPSSKRPEIVRVNKVRRKSR